MTEQTPPYVLQNASHQAKLFRQTSSTIVDNEGVINSTSLLVAAKAVPDMSVDIAAGSCWVYGDYATDAKYYFAYNDGSVNVAIAAADASNPRIDIIIAQINDSAYSGSTDDWELKVVTGTPAGSPVAPTTPSSALILATIAVGAGATTIISGNVTDSRVISEVTISQAAHIAQAGAPAATTDRLYNVAGALFWNGTAVAQGDITGVTAGTAMSGGGTSGTVTVNVDVNSAGSVTAATSDYVLIEDVDDNTTKKALISDIIAHGDITSIVTAAASGLSGGATSGAVTLTLNLAGLTAAQNFGADGAGVDVTLHSDTAGDYALWDSSEEKLILEGTNGATVLDVTDGNVVIGDGTLVVGSDGAGEDVTFHSDTAGDSFLWDSSEEKLILEGTNAATVLDVTDGNVSIGDGTLAVSGAVTVGTDGAGADVTFHSATASDNFLWDASDEKLVITGTDGQNALEVADGDVEITDQLTVSGGLVAPLQINAQTGTTYTFVLADAGKMVTSSNGSAQTLTVPPNSSVAYATGTQIIVQAIGSGTATLAEGSGVTINSKDSNKDIDGQYAAATLIKTATDTWSLIGALA
jgi:hypothetical protein